MHFWVREKEQRLSVAFCRQIVRLLRICSGSQSIDSGVRDVARVRACVYLRRTQGGAAFNVPVQTQNIYYLVAGVVQGRAELQCMCACMFVC